MRLDYHVREQVNYLPILPNSMRHIFLVCDDTYSSATMFSYSIVHQIHFMFAASIKFHKIRHWPQVIQLFGAPANYNAETWESAHRWYVKQWLGKLQHCNESSNKSLLRRTTIAISHGGATQLEHPNSIFYQRKQNYWVRGQLPGSCFKSIYLLRITMYGWRLVNLLYFQ